MPHRTVRVLGADVPGALDAAAAAIAAGDVVAVPTDTLYGLAADATNNAAVEKVFVAKGRRDANPLPVIAADIDQVTALVGTLTPLARRLAEAFWPGPLSLIVPVHPAIAGAVHAGTGTVAVRVPAQAFCRALALRAGCPLTATSANRSGTTPARSAANVREQLGDAVALIVDGGPSPETTPSTIVDVTGSEPVIVRAGVVPADRIFRTVR